jgi:phosphoserine phosphatase
MTAAAGSGRRRVEVYGRWPSPVPSFAMAAAPATGYVVTVIRPLIGVELMSSVAHLLSTVAFRVTGMRTLATEPCTALEVSVELDAPVEETSAALALAARKLATQCRADIAVRPADARHRLVAFDVDATLVRGEAIDVLAGYAGRAAEVREVTTLAMRGDLDFVESLRLRVGALAGLPAEVLPRAAAELELSPGAHTAVRALRARNIRVGAISGGFRQIVDRLADRVGLDFSAANELEIIDGRLTGRLCGPVLDRAGKADALRRFAAAARIPLAECVAVGDGANDIDMLRTAGLGIAYNGAAVVRAAANASISQPRLDLVLPLLGIPVPTTVLDAAA